MGDEMDPWLASRYGGVSPEDATGHYKWRGATPRRHPDDEPPSDSRRGRRARAATLAELERWERRRERRFRRVIWSVPVLIAVFTIVTALGWNPLV